MAEETDKLLEDLKETMKSLKGSIEALSAATLKNINETAAASKRKTLSEQQLEKAADMKKRLKEIDDAFKEGYIDIKGANQQRKEEYKKFKESNFGSAASDLSKEFKKLAPEIGDFGLRFGETTADLKKGAETFAKTTGNLAKDIFTSASGAKPLGAALEIAKAESSAFGGLLQQGGGYLATFGAGLAKSNKILGGLFGLAGGAAMLTGKGLGVTTKVLETVGNAAIAFQDEFTKANAAGATFADGMGQLRDTAANAGVVVSDLVAGISASQEAFQRGGLNFQQSAKLVGSLNKSLSEGTVAGELYALGFTDNASRIALVGYAFDRARANGMSYADAQKDLTSLTVQYAKDLKTLQGIAGKDAQKAMDRANLEVQRGALINKLNDDQIKAYTGQFTALEALGPELKTKAQIALTQAAAGLQITDPDILVNRPVLEMIQTMAAGVQQGSKTVAEAGRAGQQAMIAARQKMLGPEGEMGRTLSSTSLQLQGSASKIAQGGGAVADAMLQYKGYVEEGGTALDDTNKASQNLDPTTQAFNKINIAANKLQVALQQVILSEAGIKIFSHALTLATDSVYSLINSIKGFAGSNAVSNAVSGIPSASNMLTDAAVLAAAVGAGMMGGGKPPIPPVPPTSSAPYMLPREPVPPGGGGAGGAIGYISEKAGAALEFMKSWFAKLEGLVPESLSSKLNEGLNTVKGFFGKLMTEVGESTIGKALSLGAEKVAYGFGKVTELFKSAGNTAGNVLSKVGGAAKVLPLTGDLYEAYSNYQESGDIKEATVAGLGSFGARTAALGAAPVTGLTSALLSGVAGVAGAQGSAALYRAATGGRTEKPSVSEATPTTAVGTPASTLTVDEQLKKATTLKEKENIIKRAEKEALDNITKLGLQIDKLNSENLKKPSLEIEKALAEAKDYLDKEKAKYQSLLIAQTTLANKDAIKPPMPEAPVDEKTRRYNESLREFKERWNPSDISKAKPENQGTISEKTSEAVTNQQNKLVANNATLVTTPTTGAPAIDLTSKVTETSIQQQQILEETKRQAALEAAKVQTLSTGDNATNQILQTLSQEIGNMTHAFEDMMEYMRSIATNTKNTFHAVS